MFGNRFRCTRFYQLPIYFRFQDIDLVGFKIFMDTYLEMTFPSELLRRLFLSFARKTQKLPFGVLGGIEREGGGRPGGGLFSQSSSTITGAFHSLGSRYFGLSGGGGQNSGQGSNSLSKPAPSQSVPEGTKLLCTVS